MREAALARQPSYQIIHLCGSFNYLAIWSPNVNILINKQQQQKSSAKNKQNEANGHFAELETRKRAKVTLNLGSAPILRSSLIRAGAHFAFHFKSQDSTPEESRPVQMNVAIYSCEYFLKGKRSFELGARRTAKLQLVTCLK